jgi:hypothetical protein
MIIFINIDKIIFINTTVINRRICYILLVSRKYVPDNLLKPAEFSLNLSCEKQKDQLLFDLLQMIQIYYFFI